MVRTDKFTHSAEIIYRMKIVRHLKSPEAMAHFRYNWFGIVRIRLSITHTINEARVVGSDQRVADMLATIDN